MRGHEEREREERRAYMKKVDKASAPYKHAEIRCAAVAST